MEFHANIAILAVLTPAVGYLMVLAGVHKSMLEWRHRRQLCPSCGRDLRSGCACR